MILLLERDDFDEFSVPRDWSVYVRPVAAGIEVVGDRTAYRDVYIWHSRDRILISTDLVALLDRLKSFGESARLSTFGLSAMLHNGLVPLPRTAYDDIFLLSMGDTATIVADDNGFSIDFDHTYEWLPQRSTNDRDPDEATLLKFLTASVERQLTESDGPAFLMLSSGKDSPAVALALAEGGFVDVNCVTYSSGDNDPEPPVAAEICRRLGLDHEVIEMPVDPGTTAEIMTRFFEHAPLPGVDLSQIPYVLATSVASGSNRYGTVIDGGGNDSYMGYPVKGRDSFKQRYRIRGRRLARTVQRTIRVDSKVNYLARSRVEATLPGRTMRLHHIRRLLPEAEDIGAWWYETSRDARKVDLQTLFAAYNERYLNASQILQKQRLAAAALGLHPSLPWCDNEIADYYFNLPELDRYDAKTGTNKVLLRRMLARYLNYDAETIGKHYFEFDGPAFLTRNMDFVRSEIEGVDIWDERGIRMINKWLDAVTERPFLYHSLLTVFMISGWYNHNPYARSGEFGQPTQSVAR